MKRVQHHLLLSIVPASCFGLVIAAVAGPIAGVLATVAGACGGVVVARILAPYYGPVNFWFAAGFLLYAGAVVTFDWLCQKHWPIARPWLTPVSTWAGALLFVMVLRLLRRRKGARCPAIVDEPIEP